MIPHEIAAVDQIGFPILSVIIFFPLLWALLLNFSGGSHVREAALVGALTELVLTLLVAFNFQVGTPELQFAEQSAWMPTLGISYHVGVDGISVLFLPVTALATVLLLLARGRTASLCSSPTSWRCSLPRRRPWASSLPWTSCCSSCSGSSR